MTNFDPVAFKNSTRNQWDNVAEHWNAWGPLLDRWLGPATETLLDMCGVQSGSTVLHIAGGSGQDALQSARRVGSDGFVLSTDFSENLTRLANDQFERAGLTQARATVMDGENLKAGDQRFDAVISRVGLIFFPDPKSSMKSQISALHKGGSVGALVYATPQECRFFSDPVGIIRKHANLPAPAPGLPGPFSLGAPGVIEDLFEAAGLGDIQTQKSKRPLSLKRRRNACALNRKALGPYTKCLEGWTMRPNRLRGRK